LRVLLLPVIFDVVRWFVFLTMMMSIILLRKIGGMETFRTGDVFLTIRLCAMTFQKFYQMNGNPVLLQIKHLWSSLFQKEEHQYTTLLDYFYNILQYRSNYKYFFQHYVIVWQVNKAALKFDIYSINQFLPNIFHLYKMNHFWFMIISIVLLLDHE
jgi:hypothetical protein